MAGISVTANRISLTHFWSDVTELFTFDTYTDTSVLIADVVTSAVQKEGQTNASKAFDHVINAGFSGSNRNILFLFSSARFTDIDDVRTKVQQLKAAGVYIATVGVGLGSNHSNLIDIASDPAFSYLIGEDVYIDNSSLQAILSTLKYDFCSGYVD